MKVYRISRQKHAKDLSGTGAKLNGGRWNSKGRAALYAAENISLAKLEVAVHLDFDIIPDSYCLIEIELPDHLKIKIVEVDELPENWNAIPYLQSTQKLGDSILDQNEVVAFKIPSAVIPQEFNYILNPNHAVFKTIKISNIESFSFDQRLFK
jgi:RES domain-containing protein